MRLVAAAVVTAFSIPASPLLAQPTSLQAAADPALQTFTVFLRSTPIGREEVSVVRETGGWTVRGTSRLGPPLDSVTELAEIRYDPEWRPRHLTLKGTARGQDVSLETTFSDGTATNQIALAGTPSSTVHEVAADTIVLPNTFLGSYAALAHRLVGAVPGASFHGYIAPQGEVSIRLEEAMPERIETPKRAIAATRYTLALDNPGGGELRVSLWADESGALLRFSVPAQMLEVAREDVASAATRSTTFALPGDEPVRIAAAGFNLAATVTKPAGAVRPLPALVLIGGSGPVDRDGVVAGIPIIGQMARELVEAGFFVVRYDKRGVGQSGGRTEASAIGDYAEDVRAIVAWLEKQRKDVDRRRIGLVGHSEGAWVALTAAARDRRVRAVALVSGAGTTGAELILEQQKHMLERMKVPEAERQAKIDLQQQIQAAVLTGTGWDGVPDSMRESSDTPWFRSLLEYDPARVMRDVRQPLLIVQGELDTQVRPHHADRLAELAAARRRKATADVVKVPGVNHLLVPATTGEVDEYPSLAGREVSTAVTSAIGTWMAREMGPR